MAEGKGHILAISCECGNSFEESLAGKDLETAEFSCPACGRKSKLSSDEIAAITAAIEDAAKQLDDAMRRIAKGSKIFQYRPK